MLQNFVTIQYMKHGFWIIAAVMLAGCGGSLEKHMNATMAYYIVRRTRIVRRFFCLAGIRSGGMRR